MRSWVLDIICCPKCGERLALKEIESVAGHVETGVLFCSQKHWYPIVRKIPRILDEKYRRELTSQFIGQYKDSLAIELLIDQKVEFVQDHDELHELKKKTMRNFGFEWLEYSRFGWDDKRYNLDHEKQIFLKKSLLNLEELKNKIVLDAGCGNGRYSHLAASQGAHVIGIDIGDGVESASKNTCESAEISIIQSDIFNLPFRQDAFDAVFSIGVLMHTGNAKIATESLAKKTKFDGTLTVHLYGKGNVFYEVNDFVLRAVTTRMNIGMLQKFTRVLFTIRKILDFFKVSSFISRFIRIDEHPHCIFDWYAAPVASHHTYKEVLSWFGAMSFKVVTTNELMSSYLKKISKPFIGGPASVTVKGRKLQQCAESLNSIKEKVF